MLRRSGKTSKYFQNKEVRNSSNSVTTTTTKGQLKRKIKNEIADEKTLSKKELWAPKQWKEQFNNIRIMRQKRDAPVDTMGCEKCKGEGFTEKEKRFHTLISLMLSSQTKDHVTHAAMQKLINDGLTVEKVIKMPDSKLEELIYPVSFGKTKTKYIKKTATILKEEYESDIPSSVDNLVKLPGVGPKMAYLTMNCAWDKVVGIGVDVHVHRIANRLKWVKKPTKDPEKTRKELEDWLPQSYWKEANWLLVGFGQQICKAKNPKCTSCLNNKICPASTAKK